MSSNATIPESEDEAKQRYEEHLKFTEMSEVHEVTTRVLYIVCLGSTVSTYGRQCLYRVNFVCIGSTVSV